MKSFLIDAANFERFEKKVKAIQKKANKIGVKAPEYKVVRLFDREFTQDLRKYTIPYVEVEIAEDKVVMDGWRFAATVEHREPLNIIRVNPDFEGDEAELKIYSTAKSVCAHCSTSRPRKHTYIMASDNGLVQVGTSCIKDFIGHPTAEYYAELYEFVRLLKDSEEKDRWARYEPTYGVRDVLEVASALVRIEGYISKKMVGISTSHKASLIFDLSEAEYKTRFGESKPEVTEADKKMAQDCIDLVSSFDEKDLNNIFKYNLKVLVDGGRIFEKDFGMLCYLPEMLAKTLVEKAKQWEKEKAEREARAKSDFIGKVSEKVVVQATYLGKIYLGSNGFNDSYLHKFASGTNQMVWSSANTLEGLTVGQNIEITGTVKDHQDYKGMKQTRLTRCKVKVL